MQGRLFRLMAIGDQASNDVDEAVDWAAMTSMFNLRNILGLIDDTFDDSSFSQEQLVDHRKQSVFHVFAEFGEELDTEAIEKLFEQRLRNVAPIGSQLAKQALTECRNWRSIIDIPRCDLAGVLHSH